MNGEQKKYYGQLKNKNRDIVRKKNRENNILLQECLTALGANKLILSADKQEEIISGFNKRVAALQNADKREIDSIQALLSEWPEKIYVIWDEVDLPVIQTDLVCIIGCEDDIKAVAFETWIVSDNMDKFIQFSSNDKIIEYVME